MTAHTCGPEMGPDKIMNDGGFQFVAKLRVHGMMTRLGLSVLATVTATLLHPSWWPTAWLLTYTGLQVIDRQLFKAGLRQADRGDTLHHAPMLVSVCINATLFSSLALYNWCVGGTEGKIFGAITICCSLISVTVGMYPKKRYLFATLVPHALYLIALPIIALVQGAGRPLPWAIVMISIITYITYLLVAVKKLNGSMIGLQNARDEAQQANAAKSNFLAVISHEIRTPMNAVVSAVNLLKATPLDATQTAHLVMLNNASEVLLGLLNDVLDLSKIEAGKMRFERATVDVRAMLSHLDGMFRPQLRDKSLRLTTSLGPDIADSILSDPLRLQQILFNLLSNAIKFTEKGTIALKVYRDRGSEGARLLFEVEDPGIGIAPEHQQRIFNSFEQAEAAITRRYGGTGLGLAISRQLARLMGGDITVMSEPGKGSRFILSLPYETVDNLARTDVTPVARPAPAEAPLHVLIVDDHEVNRRIVSLFIQPQGWTHCMAETGAVALDLCRSQRFDVILMDMQMPVMDGITATRRIRAEPGPNQMTPIVALTANALDFHVNAWAEVGVTDVLTKPIDPGRLIATLYDKAELVQLARWAG